MRDLTSIYGWICIWCFIVGMGKNQEKILNDGAAVMLDINILGQEFLKE